MMGYCEGNNASSSLAVQGTSVLIKPEIAARYLAPRPRTLMRAIVGASLLVLIVSIALIYTLWTYANIIHAPLSNALWDFKLFYGGDRDFLVGGNLYRPIAHLGFPRIRVSPNNNSPVGALIMLPFSQLSLSTAAMLWEAGSLLLLCVAIGYMWRSLRGPRGWRVRAVLLLLIYVSYPVQDTLWLGTWGIVVAFCDVAAWYFARQGSDRRAGVFLGIALVVRWQPCALLLYVIISRRWRMLIFTLLTIAISSAAAMVVFGIRSFGEFASMVVGASGAVGGAYDGSLPAALIRIVGALTHGNPQLVTIASHGGLLCSVALSAVVLWRCRTLSFDEAFSLSIVCGLLITPLSWFHYHVILLLPLAVIAQRRLWPVVVVCAWWIAVELLSIDLMTNPLLYGTLLSGSLIMLLCVLYHQTACRGPIRATQGHQFSKVGHG